MCAKAWRLDLVERGCRGTPPVWQLWGGRGSVREWEQDGWWAGVMKGLICAV